MTSRSGLWLKFIIIAAVLAAALYYVVWPGVEILLMVIAALTGFA